MNSEHDDTGSLRLSPAVAPVSADTRVASIDILRGIALFGVMAINVLRAFRTSFFMQFLPPDPTTGVVDRMVGDAATVVWEFKAISLFSFLFGVGLAIQYERLSRRGHARYWLVRRLLVLLALGLAHMLLIWNGDILTEYAIAGFVVLPLLGRPQRTLALAAAAFMILYVIVPLVPVPIAWVPDASWMREHIEVARRVYSAGTYAAVRRFEIAELPKILALELFILPRTIGLLLLGVLAWRARVFDATKSKRPPFVDIALGCVAAGLTLTLLDSFGVLGSWPTLGALRWSIANAAPVILAMGYVAAFLAVVRSPRVERALRPFAAIGRMAFTTYVTESLIFGWLFFGYGAGLFGRVGPAVALVIGAGVYTAQMALSAAWLTRYQFGPIEWLWRSLMYGARQPMRVAAGQN